MKIHEDVLTGKSWELWDSALRRKASGTRRIYLRHFTNFLKWAGMNSEEFYLAYSNAEGREKIALQSMVLDRVQELEDQGYSSQASHQTIKAVSSFLRSNGEAFTLSVEKHQRRSQGSRIIEKSEIKLLLEKTTNWRNKAMIMCLRDSGLRVSDLAQITYGHLEECLRHRADFCIFTIVQQKTGNQAKVCLGYESFEYLRKWIEEREQYGERLTSETPLWVTLNPRPDLGVRVGERLSHYSISSRIRDIVKRAGLKNVSAHSLRKYFITRMMLDGMHESLVNILVGKKVSESKSPYIHYSDRQLLEEYRKHYSAISFDVIDKETIEQLQDENAELRQRIDNLEEFVDLIKNFPELAQDNGPNPWKKQQENL